MPGETTRFEVIDFPARTLVWWSSKRNQIEMDPVFQRRGRLWSTADKAYLIDSILNGYDIPKLYIADFTLGGSALNTSRKSYAIIDGKQRMETVFDFFDGRLVLHNQFLLRRDPKLSLGGLGYRDLKEGYPEIAEDFENFHFSVMRVIADDEKLINELFVRLNRSKPLTGAEIRNAMAGPVPGLVRQIAQHEFFEDYVKFTVTRGQDLNTAAKFLLLEYHGELRETKKKNLDSFAEDSQNLDPKRLELAYRVVLETMNTMTAVFLPKDKLLRASGILPVYYWLIRSTSSTEIPILREFLTHFENQRTSNRALVEARPSAIEANRTLLDFDAFNRSTNDARSHAGRYMILKSMFVDWAKAHTRVR